MYEIQDMTGFQKGDSWEVRKNGKPVYRGGFKELLRYTVGELGFKLEDFDKAVVAIVNQNHDTMSFDRNNRLTSSHNSKALNRRNG